MKSTEETTVYEEVGITMQLDSMHDRLDRLEECLEFDLPFLYQELAKRVRKLEDAKEITC